MPCLRARELTLPRKRAHGGQLLDPRAALQLERVGQKAAATHQPRGAAGCRDSGWQYLIHQFTGVLVSTVFMGSVNIYVERQHNCLHFIDAVQFVWHEQSWGLWSSR